MHQESSGSQEARRGPSSRAQQEAPPQRAERGGGAGFRREGRSEGNQATLRQQPSTTGTRREGGGGATAELAVGKAQVELGDKTALAATVKNGKKIKEYAFQIKKGTGAWLELKKQKGAKLNLTARVAGRFKLRVLASVSGSNVASGEKDLEVQFPGFAKISGNSKVKGFCKTAWQQTLKATTATSRREQGFWIRLNTKTMKYEKTADDIQSPASANNQGAAVNLRAKPADAPANPAPNVDAVYTVASFHTHTPMTYRTGGGRPTGPSGADGRCDTRDNVCGLVYDYTIAVAPPGHKLKASAKIYHSGPQRRTTPA